MKRFTRTAMVSLCLALMLCAGVPVGAQTVQTLTIQDGILAINGQEVPQEDLPEALDLRGLNATYSFFGDARPLIEINGALYALDGQRLRAMAELRNQPGGLFLFAEDNGAALLGRYKETQDDAVLAQARALQASTDELKQLSTQVDQRQANQAIEIARERVAQAAEVVQALPKLQVQSYFSDVQQYDQNLYALLVREWRMEREAEALALEIRRLPDGAERNDRITQLRQKLDEIFELKQQNRLREIKQLELELSALNERLQKREQLRDRLINQRLSDLIGAKYPPGNR